VRVRVRVRVRIRLRVRVGPDAWSSPRSISENSAFSRIAW